MGTLRAITTSITSMALTRPVSKCKHNGGGLWSDEGVVTASKCAVFVFLALVLFLQVAVALNANQFHHRHPGHTVTHCRPWQRPPHHTARVRTRCMVVLPRTSN
jgi:hypothetical protein